MGFGEKRPFFIEKAGGFSSVYVLMVLLCLGLLTTSMLNRGVAEMEIAGNSMAISKARSIAESGIDKALSRLRDDPYVTFDSQEVVFISENRDLGIRYQSLNEDGFVDIITVTGRYERAVYSVQVKVEADPFPRRILGREITEKHIRF